MSGHADFKNPHDQHIWQDDGIDAYASQRHQFHRLNMNFAFLSWKYHTSSVFSISGIRVYSLHITLAVWYCKRRRTVRETMVRETMVRETSTIE